MGSLIILLGNPHIDGNELAWKVHGHTVFKVERNKERRWWSTGDSPDILSSAIANNVYLLTLCSRPETDELKDWIGQSVSWGLPGPWIF